VSSPTTLFPLVCSSELDIATSIACRYGAAQEIEADTKISSEEDLTESLEAAMDKYPDAYAVLVKRHGV
jgi:hypothetical protein